MATMAPAGGWTRPAVGSGSYGRAHSERISISRAVLTELGILKQFWALLAQNGLHCGSPGTESAKIMWKKTTFWIGSGPGGRRSNSGHSDGSDAGHSSGSGVGMESPSSGNRYNRLF
jgi:hypothetical protein